MAVERSMDWVQFVSSSFCSLGSCVEVGRLIDGSVAVRDSKAPGEPVLVFTGGEWADFLAGARAGDFDSLPPPATASHCHTDGPTATGRVAGS